MQLAITLDQKKSIATEVTTYEQGSKTVEFRSEIFECTYDGHQFFYLTVQPMKVKGLPAFSKAQNFDAISIDRIFKIETGLKADLFNLLGTPLRSSSTTN